MSTRVLPSRNRQLVSYKDGPSDDSFDDLDKILPKKKPKTEESEDTKEEVKLELRAHRNRLPVNYKDEPSDFDDSCDDFKKILLKKEDPDFEDTKEDVKSGSSSSSDDDNEDGGGEDSSKTTEVFAPWEDPKLSEYERMILKNIEERNKFMREMGFHEAVKDLKAVLPSKEEPLKKTPARKKVIKKTTPLPPPREPSRRIRNLTAKNEEAIKKEVDEEESKENAELVDDRLLDSAEISEDMNGILNNISDNAVYNPDLNLAECSATEYKDQLLSLQMLSVVKVTPGRIASMLAHPNESKILIFAGDKYGNLGVWDPLDRETEPHHIQVHRCMLNCLSVSKEDQSIIYSTGHDGTVFQVDFSAGKRTNVFATDWDDRVKHLTWHDEFENHKLLVAHGRGDVGILDVRAGKTMQKWIDCFPRSTRTVQHHPVQEHYFLASSGTGSFKIFDLRNPTECLVEEDHGKYVNSAFFSPDGSRIVSTCGDDYIRVFDSSTFTSPLQKTASYRHNNFTGRWLTPFRSNWVPQRNDIFHVGSLLQPRRIQFYKANNGGILCDVTHDEMTTVCCVIAMHPTLPAFAGGNSSGKIHVFAPSTLADRERSAL